MLFYYTHIAYRADSFHHILSADHVLVDDGAELLRPLLGALLVVHYTHFCLLQVLRVLWYVH